VTERLLAGECHRGVEDGLHRLKRLAEARATKKEES
jgi:hypothetical protein